MSPRRFKPYPAYKDSGVEWLGEIPAHWDALKLKRVCSLAYGDSLAADARSDGQVEVYGSNGPVGLHDRANTLAPCLVIGRKGSFGKVNYSAHPAYAIDTTFFVDKRFTRADIRWLYYAAIDARLDSVTKDSTIPGLDREDAYARDVCVPPLSEQRAIAAFLDRQTARIDSLMAKNERLVELLQEKHTALITRAATKGLDPTVLMKDSGVEWLGEVPAHWDVTRMWRTSKAISGGTPAREERLYWGGGIPWVSPKDMKRRVIDSSEDTITELAIRETGIRLIDPPVVLVVVRGMILAHSFPVGVTSVPVTINQDMKALAFRRAVDPFFMVWFFEGIGKALVAAIVEEAAHGTRAIRMNQWRSVTVPLPPEDEQRTIVAVLGRQTARIDALISNVRVAIDRLQELRTALISAAVMGKIDVREEVA